MRVRHEGSLCLILVLTLQALLAATLLPSQAGAVCAEPGSYLVCEDWDSDTPPANWPCQGCPSFHGWDPADYGGGANGHLTTVYKNSGTRALAEYAANGNPNTVDIYHAVSGSPRLVHIRFYLYLTSINFTCTHLIFLNTASTAEVALDFRDCRDQTYKQCDGMFLVPHSYGPEVWQANNQGTNPFNWRNHLNEWVLVEWRVDLANKRSSLWINETPQLIDYSIDWADSSVSDIIVSGYRCIGTSGAQYYYIDDFVVSTSYIGPRRASGVDTSAPTTSGHSPAKNATGVAADTNISLHVLDSGDGVNRSSIVMTVNGQTVTPTITGSPADYTVSYNPPVDFSPGQTVTVTLDASDLHNPPNVMPRDSYRFTVAADTTPPAAPTGVRVNVQ